MTFLYSMTFLFEELFENRDRDNFEQMSVEEYHGSLKIDEIRNQSRDKKRKKKLLQPGIDPWTSRFALYYSTNWATGSHLCKMEQSMKYKSRLLPSTGRTGRLARRATLNFFQIPFHEFGSFGLFSKFAVQFWWNFLSIIQLFKETI